MKKLFALALFALLVTGLAACGGSDDSSSAQSTANGGNEKQAGGESSSDEASAEFLTPGGDNSIQTYGEEADSAELAAAEEVIVAYLGARAKADWEASCEYLAKTSQEQVEQLSESSPQLKGKACGTVIGALLAGLSKSALSNPAVNGIAALRVHGDHGFALFHGPKGAKFFVSVEKEDGEWKVSSLAPSEFP